jgi:hypothetical protein
MDVTRTLRALSATGAPAGELVTTVADMLYAGRPSPSLFAVVGGEMDPYHDGMPSYGRYEEDDRCPYCFVPPRAPHLDSCEYDGVWEGSDDQGPDRSGGHWGG